MNVKNIIGFVEKLFLMVIRAKRNQSTVVKRV